MAALVAGLYAKLDKLAIDFITGRTSQYMFRSNAATAMNDAHVHAAELGAERAGVQDYAFGVQWVGRQSAQSQNEFMAGFAEDLAAGRYKPTNQDGEGAAARKLRFQLYGNRLVGTANAAFALVIGTMDGEDGQVRWVMDPSAKHCTTCPEEASIGWRPAATMTHVPGDASCQCGANCKCHIETRNGITGFRVP